MKRSIFGWALFVSIIILFSACSHTADNRPVTDSTPIQFLFPTTSGGLVPATGAPVATQVVPTYAAPQPVFARGNNPGLPDTGSEPAARPLPFDAFVNKIKNGAPDLIVGVYVENVLALKVVQQPPTQPDFVSTHNGDATQFLLAYSFAGNIGLLAHNYLSGALFYHLKNGDVVQIIYGDGNTRDYEVDKIESYQALKPDSPTSDFLDPINGDTMSATDLFYRVYGGDHHVTFQTCISQDNNTQWGRLFVLADPM